MMARATVTAAADAAFQDVLLALFQLHGRVLDAADGMAADLELTGARWQVLRVIARAPMTASQVARRLGLKRQSVQRTVDQLADAGLVALRANRDHLRAPLVAPTAAGSRALAALEARRGAWVGRVLAGLPAARLATLATLLGELNQRVEAGAPAATAAAARPRHGRRLVAA